jgi:mannose-6-phosphate isomerase-like protein (cupin superfamily)
MAESYKYVKRSEAISRGEGSAYIIRNFITKSDTEKISMALSELQGKTSKTVNSTSDRIYYFITGSAEFNFGNNRITVEGGSVLLVRAGTEYSMDGRFVAILVNAPAFDIANETHFN